jgi:hypothetical protein
MRIIICKKLIYLISFVLVLSVAGNASADLLVHRALEDGSGTTTFDISGNGHEGEFSGEPQWIEGHGGRSALQFDGVDDFVVYWIWCKESHNVPQKEIKKQKP